MKFTDEQLAKAKAAESAEELLALAKEAGIEMTAEEADKYFAELHKEGELSDDELDNVSGGGCGWSIPDPRVKNGTHLWIRLEVYYHIKHVKVVSADHYDDDDGWCYYCAVFAGNSVDSPITGYEYLYLDNVVASRTNPDLK